MIVPRKKLPASPTHSSGPLSPRVPVSEEGIQPISLANISPAARSRAMPMPIWIARRGMRETTPPPIQAPATAVAMRRMSVVTSTSMTAMPMKACVAVGRQCPTLSVPGMSSSRTSLRRRKYVVEVAKLPMPSASKKFAKNPTAIRSASGRPRSGVSTPTCSSRLFCDSRNQKPT